MTVFEARDRVGGRVRSRRLPNGATVEMGAEFFEEEHMSVPERYWTWTARGADGSVEPVVSCFAGSARALDGLAVAEGPEKWLASLRALRPDLHLEPSGAVLSTWWEPWTGGAYSVSLVDRPQRAGPWRAGRVVYCGEHTAGDHASLMKGALRSGLRAAEDVGANWTAPHLASPRRRGEEEGEEARRQAAAASTWWAASISSPRPRSSCAKIRKIAILTGRRRKRSSTRECWKLRSRGS